jgi:hypothetical protein
LSFFSLLAREVDLLATQYAERRAERPALAAYPTLHALYRRLVTKDSTRESMQERNELLRALLCAYQGKPDRLWLATVLAACSWMVRKVRTDFHGTTVDERESLFLEGLLRVLPRIDPHDRPEILGLIVWRAAKKPLVRMLDRETAREEFRCRDLRRLAAPAAPELDAAERLSEVAALHLARRLPPGARLRGLPTSATRVSLKAHVEQQYGHLPPEEQRRAYKRLQRKRHREVVRNRLRKEMLLQRSTPVDATSVACLAPSKLTTMLSEAELEETQLEETQEVAS